MKKRYQKAPSNLKERISKNQTNKNETWNDKFQWSSKPYTKEEIEDMNKVEEKKEINSFKDVYTFPLELNYGKVHTADFGMAFDFIPRFLNKEAIQISDEDKQKIVDILNGKDSQIKEHKLIYEDGEIKLNDKPFIMIRGWGYLTGTGGLNLPSERARELQDEFGKFIVEKLTVS